MSSAQRDESTILVVTTVHHADDTRIRERLIRTLAREHKVVYATKSPPPTDRGDHDWIGLGGGRLSRFRRAFRVARTQRAGAVVLHDPELVPVGLALRLLDRQTRVVFDLHESFPDQVLTKEQIPRLLRRPLWWMARLLMRLADRYLEVTLAEPGYQRLLSRPASVFENYPDTRTWPLPETEREKQVIYVGDITMIRGAADLVEACRIAGLPLLMVGRVSGEAESILAEAPDGVMLAGRLPNPEAMALVRRSAVGVSPLWDVPNYLYSQPTKVLEYLACGVPVVATDLPGTRALLDGLDAVAWVQPRDPSALAEAIIEMLDSGMAEKAVAQAAMVRGRFSWPAHRVLEFYRS